MTTIDQLLEKYLAGDTSAAEEQTLRRHFADHADALPPEWRVYRALFAYEEAERNAAEAATPPPAKLAAAAPSARRRWLYAAAAAAIVAAVALPTLMRPLAQRQRDFAIIDGKKTIDAATVASEAEQALALMAPPDDEDLEALDMMK